MSWTKRAMTAALVLATPLTTGATSLTSNWQARVLAAQNRERALLDVAPLQWSDSLAVSAQSWADHLARTRTFRHAPQAPTGPEGENLWMGTKGFFSVDDMVGGWLSEKANFRPGIFPANSRTGRLEDVGHYTQIVWRRTKTVGCAIAHTRSDDLLVCRYSQAGNFVGERPY